MLKSLQLDRALLVKNNAQILENEAQILELRVQISALEAAILVLQAEKQPVQQRLESYKYPVLTLPNEIIGEIFLHFLPPYPEPPPLLGEDSPTILTHICHQWRDIALTTPALWRSIDLKDVPVEAATALACSWLKRSGCLPLSIHATDYGTLFSVFPIFIPHRARWEHLNLRIQDTEHLLVLDGPAPLLQTLHVFLRDEGLSNPISLQDFPLLHTVVLDDYGTPSLILPWSQLTRLSLSCMYPADCISILRQTLTLVTCNLEIWIDPIPPNQLVDIPLLHLETLVFELSSDVCVDFMQLLVTPSLRRLELHEDYLDWDDENGSDPTAALKSFITKSGCMLDDLRVTTASITEDAYRTAFPSIQSIQLF